MATSPKILAYARLRRGALSSLLFITTGRREHLSRSVAFCNMVERAALEQIERRRPWETRGLYAELLAPLFAPSVTARGIYNNVDWVKMIVENLRTKRPVMLDDLLRGKRILRQMIKAYKNAVREALREEVSARLRKSA